MNITINITSSGYEMNDDGRIVVSKSKKNKKSRFYKRPGFWLLLVFIVSITVRMLSKHEKRILTEISQEDSQPPDNLSLNSEPNEEKSAVKNTKRAEKAHKQRKSEKAEEKPQKKEKKSFRFVLNTATKRYHTKNCGAVGKLADEKRGEADIEAESLDEAKKILEEQGYTLCGLCGR